MQLHDRADDGGMRQPAGLTPFGKAVYALGDTTVSTALASLSLIYASYFLTQVAGLRPALAGLVPLIGRLIDAVCDPLMGRLSDRTTWRGGRRRPYFLIGALPFGIGFAAMWIDLPDASQTLRFAYYTLVYTFTSLAMTVVSIPYLALLPEMAEGYDERTSLNTYRNVGGIVGIFIAIGIRPLAEACGGGASGYAIAGALVGVLLALPWPLIHRFTFERQDFQRRPAHESLWAGLRGVVRHGAFIRLTVAYLSGRVAMDLISALLILYVTYWIGRSGDFEVIMLLFLVTVVLVLPAWLRLARGRDKATIFIAGSLWWVVSGSLFLFATPAWPTAALVLIACLTGVGFAVVDLMPWAMLGEVIDEDDLASGERREGLYNGIFAFLRKLAGALAVFLALGLLDLLGFRQGEAQSEVVRQAIRWMTAAAPALFLTIGALALWGYPLTRAAHEVIRAQLSRRD
jgi:sugar (glycoside-pentoside-hexuronide) transporter